jgi:hypothetical protein
MPFLGVNNAAALPASTLRDAVLAHPAMAKGLNQLFANWTH